MGARLLVVLTVTLLARAAVSQEVAFLDDLRHDLDGNGQIDLAGVRPSGHIEVVLNGAVKRYAFGFRPRRAELKTHSSKGHRYLLATAYTRSAAFAKLLWLDGASYVEIWSGRLGPMGSDAEWSQHLVFGPGGPRLFERRPGYRLCGEDRDAELFPRVFDPRAGQRRFRSIATRLDDEGVSELPGTPVALAPAGLFFTPQSASSRAGSTTAGELAVPTEIADGLINTSWYEGHTGFGRGAFVNFRSRVRGTRIAALRIVPGDGRSPSAFREFNRPRSLLVRTQGKRYILKFPPNVRPGQALLFRLPEPQTSSCVSVALRSVYEGSGARKRVGTTALAEVHPLSVEEASGRAVEPELVKAYLESSRSELLSLLLERPAAVERAVLNYLRSNGADKASEQAAAWRLLAQVASPSSKAELLRGLSLVSQGRDRAPLVRALVALGAKDELLALLQDAKLGGGTRSLILGSLPAASLFPLLDQGSLEQRSELVAKLVRARPLERAQSLFDSRPSVDLARVLHRLLPAGVQPDPVARSLESLLVDKSGFADHYYSLPIAAARPALSAALAAALQIHRSTGSKDIALRRRVAAALHPSNKAIALELARDSDPGVRAALLRSFPVELSVATDLLQGDRWAFVRTAASAGVAKHCKRSEAMMALLARVHEDPAERVQEASLSWIAQCQSKRSPGILLSTAQDDELRAGLRSKSLRYLSDTKYSKLAGPVGQILQRARRRSFENPELVGLAVAAAGTLGGMKARSAEKQLIDATRDEAYPRIQAAAVGSLGQLCGKRSVAAIRRVRASERQVQLAVRRALAKCSALSQ